jgi:hypothetical protein
MTGPETMIRATHGHASVCSPSISLFSEKVMETSQRSHPVNRFLLATIASALTAGVLPMSAAVIAAETAQKHFPTPEAAVDALIAGLAAETPDSLLDIFGREYEDRLIGSDEAASRANRKRAHDAATEMHRLREDAEDRRTLIIGPEAWPVPFPIVKAADGWHFDTAAGIEELVNRRIGENELNAIAVARAYLLAQKQYASADRDGDEVLEYAQQLGSTEGKRDGLYWEVEAGSDEEESPFGPLVADARDYLEGREPGDPYKGYYFKIISRQGANVPGGRYDYIINGNMIAGFALLAYPADYGVSGIMSVLISHHGKLYEKDLGEDTFLIGVAMETYNPDDSWEELTD